MCAAQWFATIHPMATQIDSGRGQMFSSLASLSVRHPRRVAAVAVILFVAGGVFGGPAAGLLNARNAFQDPGSDAAIAERSIERRIAPPRLPRKPGLAGGGGSLTGGNGASVI